VLSLALWVATHPDPKTPGQGLQSEIQTHESENKNLTKQLNIKETRIQELDRQLKAAVSLQQAAVVTAAQDAEKLRQMQKEMRASGDEKAALQKQLLKSDSARDSAAANFKAALQDADAQKRKCAKAERGLAESTAKVSSRDLAGVVRACMNACSCTGAREGDGHRQRDRDGQRERQSVQATGFGAADDICCTTG
jgi:DNA repair exonuclease SbcCD ATPase subunit